MFRKDIRSYKVGPRFDVKSWHNSLQGVPAFLIGNGPSVDKLDLSCLNNQFTIGINRAFLKIDPTLLMWQDAEISYSYPSELNRLKAIKFCRDISDTKGRFYQYRLQGSAYKLPEYPSVLHGRGSTGPLAFQLAYALGCNPIILLGFDCMYMDGKTDFYGTNTFHNPNTLPNCVVGLKWVKSCDGILDIINCSRNNVFETCNSLDIVVNQFATTSQNRKDLNNKLLVL